MHRCLVVLCVVLSVTTVFASSKSVNYLNLSVDQAQLSLWNGDPADLGSSVSGAVGNLIWGQGPDQVGALTLAPGVPNNWNGGMGNWSNAGNWSAGKPGANSDVTISSGSGDTVRLDVSTTISSLTLGGNNLMSELTDGGVAQTLTITNALNIGVSGELDLTGGSTVTVGAASSNAGDIYVLSGSTLSITGGFTTLAGGLGGTNAENGGKIHITGDVTNAGFLTTDYNGMGGNNTLTIVGNLTNSGGYGILGPGDKGSISGNVNNSGGEFLVGGTVSVGGSLTNNAGALADVHDGGTLTVTGDVTNSAVGGFTTGFVTGLFGAGGNTLIVGGTFTNNGAFGLFGAGDKGTVGSLINNAGAGVDVDGGGSTLTITGDVINSSGGMNLGIYTGLSGTGNNTINIGGTLTNNGNFELLGLGDMGSIGKGLSNSGTVDVLNGSTLAITAGGATNSGMMDVEQGSTLKITGDVTNNGNMGTDLGSMGGGSTLTITGNLTNNVSFFLNGAGDMGTITGNVSNGDHFIVANGATGMIGGNLMNNGHGTVDLENGGMLTVAGDATNSFGLLSTDFFKQGGGNTLTINGTLTNGMNFEVLGHGDVATVGNLTNNAGAFVDVEGGSTLNITGDVTNSSGGAVGEHGLFIRGNPGGNAINIGGSLTNTGNFWVLGPGDKATVGMGVTNDAGARLDIEGGSTLTTTGDVNNAGIFQTNFNGFGGGNTITIDGMLANSGTVSLTGSGDTLSAMAGLTNSGVINVNNGSSILPPIFNNLGKLNIDGTSRFVVGTPTPMGGQGYIQLANGFLGEMIAGMSRFGTVNVTGSVLLDGTLAIQLQGGFNPAVGSEFMFLDFTPGMLSGNFATIENDIFDGGTEKWVVNYDNADGFVELVAEPNPVPEPATLLLLVPGLLGMGYRLRRQLFR